MAVATTMLEFLRRRLPLRYVVALMRMVVIGAACGGSAGGPGWTSPAVAADYAFAKASPLVVYESAALAAGRKEAFEFGQTYEVVGKGSEHVKLKLRNGREAFVRASHVAVVSSPRWIEATEGFTRSARPRTHFWESSRKLQEFLSGINQAETRSDYEEVFTRAPKRQAKLPALETDTIEVVGRSTVVRVASVMVPISRSMVESFESAKSKARLAGGVDLHLLLDNSGSTRGFLEPSVTGLVKVIGRSELIKRHVNAITVTTFGESRTTKIVNPIGAMSLEAIGGATWHPAGDAQPTDGDSEPLLDGLVAAGKLIASSEASPVLIVLAGADVKLSGYVLARGRELAIENLDLPTRGRANAIFAQITPEPGTDLRDASRRLRGFSNVAYVDYSKSLVDDVIRLLAKAADGGKPATMNEEAFGAYVEVAQARDMIALLPRVLSSEARLPARLAYAEDADWYTVRLWLTLDRDLWTLVEK